MLRRSMPEKREILRQGDDSFLTTAFSATECALINAAEGRARAVLNTRMWCAKEAAAKSFGRGLATALEQMDVTPCQEDPGRMQVYHRPTGAAVEILFGEGIGEALVVAIALRRI